MTTRLKVPETQAYSNCYIALSLLLHLVCLKIRCILKRHVLGLHVLYNSFYTHVHTAMMIETKKPHPEVKKTGRN